MIAHSKKTFILPSVWVGTEYNRVPIWKKSLLIVFENYHGIPCCQIGRVDRFMHTLLMVNINPICKR